MAKLLSPLYPHSQYANGILLLSCLPGTINVCVAQTLSAGKQLDMDLNTYINVESDMPHLPLSLLLL